MATGEMFQDHVLSLDSSFNYGLDRTLDHDMQMPDLTGQTSDYMTAGEPSLVRGKVPSGRELLSGNNLDPAIYSSFCLHASFNDGTTVFDARYPTSGFLATPESALTQGHLRFNLDDTLKHVNELSDVVHSNSGLDADIRLYDLQSSLPAPPPMGHFNINLHEHRIDDTVMLDPSPSLSVVENYEMIGNSHTHQAPFSLQHKPNMPVDISFMEVLIAPTGLTDSRDLVGHEKGTQNLACHERAQYATTEDWKKYRSEIAKLYWDDNKTLNEVQAIMKTQHGFNATENMYKKRIHKWQLRKNCKTAEKEAILRCMDTQENLGVDLGRPMLNGKPVKMHLIDRHRKEKRKADDLASEDDQLGQKMSSDTCHIDKRTNFAIMMSVEDRSLNTKRARTKRQASTMMVSFSHITDPTEYRNTQDLLVQLDNYINAKLDRDPQASMKVWEKSSRPPGGAIHISYSFQDEDLTCRFEIDADLFTRFQTAFDCLDSGQVRSAWKMVNEGAAMVCASLQQQSPELLHLLLRNLAMRNERKYPEIVDQLLRQFSAVSMTVLGQRHPITNVCRLLQAFPNSGDIGTMAMQKTLDAFERRLGRDHPICFEIREKTCLGLIDQNKYDEAKHAVEQLLKICGKFQGQDDLGSRSRFYELAGLYHDLRKTDEAEDILIDVVERGIEAGHLDLVNIWCNEIRGLIRERRGDHNAAESLLWTALSGSLLGLGSQHPSTAAIWINYQDVRRKQQQYRDTADAQAEELGVLSVDSKEPVRCFSRPRSWSFPLQKPALRIATQNVEGHQSIRSRKREDTSAESYPSFERRLHSSTTPATPLSVDAYAVPRPNERSPPTTKVNNLSSNFRLRLRSHSLPMRMTTSSEFCY